MAVRIQLRRDTAANWISSNPTLRAGEIGIETDTLKMKVGNGSSTWTQITNYMNVVPSALDTTLNGYLEVTDLNNTVAALNGVQNLLIPNDSIIFEGATEDSYELTLQATDPTADRTITLPDATGTVALTSDLGITVAQVGSVDPTETYSSISTIQFDADSGFDVTSPSAGVAKVAMNSTFKTWQVNGSSGLVASGLDTVNFISSGAITLSANNTSSPKTFTIGTTGLDEIAQDAVGNAVGNGLDYDDSTGAISVDPSEFALSAIGTPTTDVSMATYKITNLGTPTSANDAATKAYVDNTTAGLNFHAAVHVATTANLDATYNNGTSGVGATLTANANGALVVDGHTLSVDERVLVKNQTTGFQNGLYVVTATGDGSNPYILTRATDADNSPAGEIAYGDFTFVQSGTTNGGYGYIVNTTGTITIGTTAISYVQFNAGQTVIAGNGLTESSPGTFAIDTTVTVDKNTAQTLTNKTLTSPVINTPTGITKSDVGLGNVENTALSTWAGSTNITTLGTIGTGTWNGSAIGTTYGGTGLTSYVTGDVLYASASNTLSKLAAGTEGYLLTMVSGVPAWAAAPISLPSQSGNSGKYLTTDGTTASWASLVVPITTGTATITADTATTIDTNALAGFTSIEYMISLKQGSKIRTSKVVLQTDGTSVDMTEFAITETGGTMSGVVVSATTSGSDAILQVTVTDASSTNVTVKFSEVKL